MGFFYGVARMYYSYEEVTSEDWEDFAGWAYAENSIGPEELESLLDTKRYRFRAIKRCHENNKNSDCDQDYCLVATYSRKSKVIEVGSFFSIGKFSLSAFSCLIKSFKIDSYNKQRVLRIVMSDTYVGCHKLLKNMKFQSRAIRVPEYVGADGITSEHLYEFRYKPKPC